MNEPEAAKLLEKLDFSGLSKDEVKSVSISFIKGEMFVGYIPANAFDFVLRNSEVLFEPGILEDNWMQAYTHASHFEEVPLEKLQSLFDLCDKDVLQQNYPIPNVDHFSKGQRLSLFRGCAGPEHRMGMSWTLSLDKAIWYAAHHAEFYHLNNLAVYVSVVEKSEIYCCGNHYDYDFIVQPKQWWSVDVPASEFRLDRPR